MRPAVDAGRWQGWEGQFMNQSLNTGRDASIEGSRGTLVGTLAMAAGALFVLGALLTIATEWGWLGLLLGLALLVYVVPQLHRFQSPADGWLGRVGSLLVAAGAGVWVTLGVIFLVWEAVGEPGEPAWTGVAWLLSFVAFLLGVVLFGVGSVKAKKFPPGAPLLMIVGLIGALAIDMATGAFFEEDASTTEWGLYIGIPLFGLGLAWMGYVLRTQARTRPAVAA